MYPCWTTRRHRLSYLSSGGKPFQFEGLVIAPLRTALLSYALACGFVDAGSAEPAMDAVVKELAPTGKLRVAIAIAPSPSAIYAIKDDTTGQYRGVTVELGLAMAKKLGLPVEFLPHRASGEIQNSAGSGKWDVTFMPVDEERKKFVDFGNAYHLLQSTYLVAPGVRLAKVEDANAAGIRIGGVVDTAIFRAAQCTAPKATFVTVPGVDAAITAMKAGQIDCIALSRESLSGLAAKIPGSHISLTADSLIHRRPLQCRKASQKRSNMSVSLSKTPRPAAWSEELSTP